MKLQNNETLREAKRLYDLGFAIIWIMEKQKRPVQSKWTTGPRTSWKELLRTYEPGYNIGVRTGAASQIGKNYLAVIDVDIKAPSFKPKAQAKIKELLGEVTSPLVMSGSGGGNRHYYVVTKEPFKMLTALKADDGEVCIYSDGRQMVLPPSLTTGQYKWKREVKTARDLPLVQFEILAAAPSVKSPKVLLNKNEVVDDIKFEDVPLDWLDIPDKVKLAITKGKDVDDRSSYLLVATSALHSAGLTRNQILSVLTDPSTYLGKCAYDHAKTKSRARAAQWLLKFTVKKVLSEKREASSLFKAVPLPKFEAPPDDGKQNWRVELSRTGPEGDGPPRHTVENVVLILSNVVSKDVVRRNEFANRDAYGVKTPWGGKRNDAVTDDDIAKIKYWLGQRYRFEPADKVIQDALIVIATRNAYDPVIDWLESLPAWDGKPRLDTWLVDNFEAEGNADYNGQVFRKWLIAMVMRAKRPGSKFDWMPIFEGPQGAGKSSFGRVLVGEEFFLDNLPNLADKDSALGLQGMWGVEMGELSNMRKTEIETVKAYVTRTVDKVRPPYGRRWLESPRRCVFFGTTNRSAYLTDDTGNRRFKPLKVGKLNFKRLRKDREQLFAEALFLFNELDTKRELGLYFELTGEARIFESKIQGEKMVSDESQVMFEAMQDFIKKVQNNERKLDFAKFRILDLFEGGGALAKWRSDNRNYQFAAKMLKKFNAEKRLIKGYSYWKIDEGVGSDEEPDTPDFY